MKNTVKENGLFGLVLNGVTRLSGSLCKGTEDLRRKLADLLEPVDMTSFYEASNPTSSSSTEGQLEDLGDERAELLLKITRATQKEANTLN